MVFRTLSNLLLTFCSNDFSFHSILFCGGKKFIVSELVVYIRLKIGGTGGKIGTRREFTAHFAQHTFHSSQHFVLFVKFTPFLPFLGPFSTMILEEIRIEKKTRKKEKNLN